MCCGFFRATLFLERLLFHTFQSDYFDTAVTFSEQILFQSSCFLSPFSEPSLFCSSSFFQNSFFFRTKILQFFMAVSFRNSCFFLFRIKYLKKSYFFKAGTSTQYQVFQKSYILKKFSFSEKQYSALPTFSGELPF